MEAILKREKLPIKSQKDKQEEILKEIAVAANRRYLEELLNLPAVYLKD